MSKTAYIELPLKPEHAEDFANSPILTKVLL